MRYMLAALALLLACIAPPAVIPAATVPAIPTQPPASPPSARSWRPAPGATWQLQFTGLPVDQTVAADVYDLDLFDSEAGLVAALHAQGRRAICYLNAGSWEDWRPDAAQFDPDLLGNDYAGWPGERWLDIRQVERLAPILRARLDLCRAKGFDGVDPDNLNGYANDTGFALRPEDQLRFNQWLAEEAHARGLAIGLKNDPEQAIALEPYYDWALTEDCFAQGWCGDMALFIEAGKPVFAVEYTDTGISLEDICPQARALRFSLILKHRDLDAYRATCP